MKRESNIVDIDSMFSFFIKRKSNDEFELRYSGHSSAYDCKPKNALFTIPLESKNQ